MRRYRERAEFKQGRLMASIVPTHLTWLVAAGTWLGDQASKHLVKATLHPGEPVTIIPGLFDLIFVTNPGGIFGILRGMEGPAREIIFTVVPILAVGMMIWYSRQLPAGKRWPRIGLGLILGGAAGNLQDRILDGAVLDFLDAYIGVHHWPTFNLADSAICVGVTMLLLDGFLFSPKRNSEAPAASSPSP